MADVSYVRINDQDFEFAIALSNQIDSLCPINKSAVVRLVIEDSFEQWWTKGFLVFDNKFSALERPKNDDANELLNYKFRNDGKDTLVFRLRPVFKGQPDDTLKNDVWNMTYTFSVYDIQDITDGLTSDVKYKKLFFWEYDYQMMIQKKMSWSTAEVSPVVITTASQLTDEKRKVFTGDAIKSLITKALDTVPQQFSDNWDQGASKITWVQGANTSTQDMLLEILNWHVGAINHDPCYLQRERYSKKWVCQSLSYIFDKAIEGGGPGAYQLEQFFMDSMTEMEVSTNIQQNPQVKTPAPHKSPITPRGKASLERNIQLGNYSVIKSFELVDMAAMDNMTLLNSSPTYSNDIKSKQFNLEYKDNDIVNVKEFFRTSYTDKLKHSGCDPDPLFTLNKIKNDAFAINNVYSLADTAIGRLAHGRNQTLKAALLLNQCIVFRTKGMTFRKSGVFIGIDREAGATQNEFDNKLLGQWFVINVKHIFVGEAYVNEITAVKIHASSPLNINKVEAYTPTT